MTDTVAISLIGAGATVICSVINAMISLSNARLGRRIEQHATETRIDVADLKNQTNGLTAALIKVTGEAEHAKGVIEGSKT